jgi:3-hydroxyisobutyrate dehydrogenase-like beta-hydroxyacid dehydrogenase
LITAGHTLTGWNRSRPRATPLIEQGIAWTGTPADVGRAFKVSFSIVTDGSRSLMETLLARWVSRMDQAADEISRCE